MGSERQQRRYFNMNDDVLDIDTIRRMGIARDSEEALCLMEHDHMGFEELWDYARGEERLRSMPNPEDRLRLVVQHSLRVMKERIAVAKEKFRSLCPGVWVIYFICRHLDEETLFRYFTGRVTRREMSDLESKCRYCSECGWEFIGVGRAVHDFAVFAVCSHLISTVAVRASHFKGDEIDAWLERRQSREQRREMLEHLKICRRCRAQMQREVETWRIANPML